jgi:hypothetical protein
MAFVILEQWLSSDLLYWRFKPITTNTYICGHNLDEVESFKPITTNTYICGHNLDEVES